MGHDSHDVPCSLNDVILNACYQEVDALNEKLSTRNSVGYVKLFTFSVSIDLSCIPPPNPDPASHVLNQNFNFVTNIWRILISST